MSERLKAAFLVVAPETDRTKDRNLIKSGVIDLITIMVKDYNEAVEEAVKLVEEGYNAIELCAGFGNKGVEMISEAVSYKIPVGVVRFDNHPGLGNKSGDELFR